MEENVEGVKGVLLNTKQADKDTWLTHLHRRDECRLHHRTKPTDWQAWKEQHRTAQGGNQRRGLHNSPVNNNEQNEVPYFLPPVTPTALETQHQVYQQKRTQSRISPACFVST